MELTKTGNGINKDFFEKILQKSAEVTAVISDPNFEKRAKNITSKHSVREGFNPNENVTYDNYLPEIPNGVSQSIPQMKNNINELNVNNIKPEKIVAASNKSKLPKEVLESIRKNPINLAIPAELGGGSVLDGLGLVPKQQQPQRQQIAEQQVSTPQSIVPQYQQMQQVSIDYNAIRVIVDESVKKYMTALKKSLLSEGKENITKTDTVKYMVVGDKLQLLTDDGDLYEAELKFKKNVKRK
jgi:hypothetical protein